MAKNKLALTVTVANARLLPRLEEVREWVDGNYERCRETAIQSPAGGGLKFSFEYPFEDEDAT